MRIRRAVVWLYPALLLALGIGFQIWSFTQASAADAYRNASDCGSEATSDCFLLFPGQIVSVQVSQARGGERDTVVIQSPTHGALSATLEPSAAAAPHVRTGADV